MAGLFFRASSALDGSDILVAVVLPKSAKNAKTGALAQVYILPAHQEPHLAFKAGAYGGVCGDCPAQKGHCYVDRTKGSLMVYRAIQRGISYQQVTPEGMGQALAGLAVRLGADGDPAAIPADQLQAIMAHVTEWTGYTHQWNRKGMGHLRSVCMASCDTPDQQLQAAANGWRTFRTMMEGETKAKGEFVCPASVEAGAKKQCTDCLACDGIGSNGRRANPVILAHGVQHKVNKYKAFRLSLVA